MAGPIPSRPGGLRERKKQRTRREISDVATRLFVEHGFEAVTLAQIADAAEVSVKTIFNHFGSKEDLFFDRAEELHEGLVSAVAGRAAGQTVLEALRALTTENFSPFPGSGWSGAEDPVRLRMYRDFRETAERSPALRARLLTLTEELGDTLRQVLARELGRDPEDPPLAALVAMLVATLHLRDRVLRAAVAAGLPPAQVRGRVVGVMHDTFDRLAAAFGDIDRPPTSSSHR